jgi:uncharacterized protein YdcH (DUF465 family)
MIDLMRNIIEQFPANENTIRELMQTDPKFASLCEEYVGIANKLEGLSQMREAGATVETIALEKRYAEVEEELLTVIEGYRPV